MRIDQHAISEQLNLERVMRIELTTFSLATRCSTAELHPPGLFGYCLNRGRYYRDHRLLVKW